MGNVLANDTEDVVREVWEGPEIALEADPDRRATVREVVREEVAGAIARGEDAEKLASTLGHRTKRWAHNWRRVARTELRGALSEGVVIAAVRNGGPKVRITRIPEPNACEHCKRVFLDADGKPRIFTAEELIENGTNVGLQPPDWKPTIWPVHPNCECDTQEVPDGFGFDDEWLLVPTGPPDEGDG